MNKLQIEYIPIKDITPYENNARKHDTPDVEAIAKSITEFGFDDAIGIWGENNIIVEGHGRLLAAKKLGMDKVPCVRLDHLTDEQRRAYALAHNKTAEMSVWDFDTLADELADIPDIDMSDFGFDLDFNTEEKSGEVVEDDYDEELPKEPKAKLGDIYQLGEHRLICGDSTDVNVIDRLMDGAKAKLLLTDPPYGIKKDRGIKTTYGVAAENKYKYCGNWDNDTPSQDAFDYFREITDNQIIFGGNFFTDKLPIGTSWIVWDKVGNIEFHNPFSDCELAWTNFDKVITKKYIAIQQGFVSDEKEKRVHPTQKPVGMLADILKDFSEDNDTILDPFGGSGSTLIACEQLNRKCYMCELDPKYVDVIIDRWEKFTGEKAVLLNA